MKKRGRKTNVDLINDYVWNRKVSPKNYVMSVSREKFVFTTDFVNVNSAEQLICTISKSELPKSILLSHSSPKVLAECVDWLIKFCETFMKRMPEIRVDNPTVFDKVEQYRNKQLKQNKKKQKRKFYKP
jgi:hypothetical protein